MATEEYYCSGLLEEAVVVITDLVGDLGIDNNNNIGVDLVRYVIVVSLEKKHRDRELLLLLLQQLFATTTTTTTIIIITTAVLQVLEELDDLLIDAPMAVSCCYLKY